MERVFYCSNCGAPIAVRFLKEGELAKCQNCGATTPVPHDGLSTSSGVDDQASNSDSGWTFHSTTSTVISPGHQPLTGTPRQIRNVIIVGLVQILLMSIYLNSGDGSVEIMGSRIMTIGGKEIVIESKAGVEYVDGPEAERRYGGEQLLFALAGDSAEDGEVPVVLADCFNMEGLKNFKALADYIAQETTDSIVSRNVKGYRFEMVSYIDESPNSGYYVYSKFFKAFPYFVRLRAVYYDDPDPPAEVLELVKLVKVQKP